MIIKPQRLAYRLEPLNIKYSRKLQENLAASHETFSDLQTPGWSSLMKSQLSDKTKKAANDGEGLKQASIYNKLNQGDTLKWSSEDQKKFYDYKSKGAKYQEVAKKQQQNSSKQKNVNKNSPKRWNQITVHQHLYQNSLKLQNKKLINKILDDQFKKQQVFKFTPTINKKSILLAQQKFSRIKQRENQVKLSEQTLQTNETENKQKDDKQISRYRSLNKLFYILSQQKTLLTQQSLCYTLQKLPLPCIKVMQPIIQKIYKGHNLEWLDFLQNFNDKKIKGKQGFFAVLQNWFIRNEHSKLD